MNNEGLCLKCVHRPVCALRETRCQKSECRYYLKRRAHGYWIMHDDEVLGLSCECSNCHIETCGDTPFCCYCGAIMDEEVTHEEG